MPISHNFKVGDRVRTTTTQPPGIGVKGVMGRVVEVVALADLPLIVLFDGHKEAIAMRVDEVEGIPT